MVKTETLTDHIQRVECASRTLPPNETTNSYVVHSGKQWLLIDPGFHERSSWDSLLSQQRHLGQTALQAVLLTHSHKDHCAGLPFVNEAFADVPVYLHANEHSRLEYPSLRKLEDGEVFHLGSIDLQAIFSPGHSPGHLSFFEPRSSVLMVGDLLSTSGSTWVGVPDGSIAAYFDSLSRLETLPTKLLAPGHGPVSHKPMTVLQSSRDHRLKRLEQVYHALHQPQSLRSLQQRVYPQLADGMTRFADASLLALVAYLEMQNRIQNLGQSEDVENQVFAQRQ